MRGRTCQSRRQKRGNRQWTAPPQFQAARLIGLTTARCQSLNHQSRASTTFCPSSGPFLTPSPRSNGVTFANGTRRCTPTGTGVRVQSNAGQTTSTRSGGTTMPLTRKPSLARRSFVGAVTGSRVLRLNKPRQHSACDGSKSAPPCGFRRGNKLWWGYLAREGVAHVRRALRELPFLAAQQVQ
jgi:hypothetical protein